MADPPRVVAIVPTYGNFDYAARAICSFFKYTAPPVACILLDDASPGWRNPLPAPLMRFYQDPLFKVQRFTKNGGLTRSWNIGLRWAIQRCAEFTVCTNSDVIFTPNWEGPLHACLTNGYHLVGPLSNAPGVTARGLQDVTRYCQDYKLSDEPRDLELLAGRLAASYGEVVAESPVNGFFLMARTADWWSGAFDRHHVFNPARRLTRNEDELQGRWRKLGRRSAIALGSFIFHYRSVSRGQRHVRDQWYRSAHPDHTC